MPRKDRLCIILTNDCANPEKEPPFSGRLLCFTGWCVTGLRWLQRIRIAAEGR